MKTKSGGSGVKAAKLLTEVNAIINDSKLSTARKVRLLNLLRTEGRPGAPKAREIIEKLTDDFSKKYHNYLHHVLIPINGLPTSGGKYPRGLKNAWKSKANWASRFDGFLTKEEQKAKKGIYYSKYDLFEKVAGIDARFAYGKNYFIHFNSMFGPACKPYAYEIIKEVRKLVVESNEKNKAAIKFYERTGLNETYMKDKPSFTNFTQSLSCPDGYIEVNRVFIAAGETEEKDWNAYSKAWHRAHGPKRWIDSRYLEIHEPGKGCTKTIYVDRWGEKNILTALARFFNVKKQPCPKGRKPVQLNDYFSVRLIKTVNGYEIYDRQFSGSFVDYAIFDTKTRNTFHSEKMEELIPGLRRKLQAKFDHENETITKETGFELGFCETGMRSFAEDNGIDYNGTYTRQELRNIVIEKRELNNRRYRRELAKVGIHLGR